MLLKTVRFIKENHNCLSWITFSGLSCHADGLFTVLSSCYSGGSLLAHWDVSLCEPDIVCLIPDIGGTYGLDSFRLHIKVNSVSKSNLWTFLRSNYAGLCQIYPKVPPVDDNWHKEGIHLTVRNFFLIFRYIKTFSKSNVQTNICTAFYYHQEHPFCITECFLQRSTWFCL